MNAMKEVCSDRLKRFGAEGMASKIKVLTLDQMAINTFNLKIIIFLF